jgi:hypothetical protein
VREDIVKYFKQCCILDCSEDLLICEEDNDEDEEQAESLDYDFQGF